MSQTINVMRWIAVAVSAATLWLIFSAAREAAGDWASVVAGTAWIASPFVVSHSVYATPDPFVYLTVQVRCGSRSSPSSASARVTP